MDIYCPLCGEPWDMANLHIATDRMGKTMPYRDAVRRFFEHGCLVFDSPHNKQPNLRRAHASRAFRDMLGDNVEGIAAMMDDFQE